VSYDPRDDTEVHSLGTILVKLRAVSRQELEEVISLQREMSQEDLLGELLLRRGIISEDQLHEALKAQRDLRSKKPRRRAMAAADLAARSGRAVSQLAAAVRESVWASRKKRTSSTGYPAVTAEDLRKADA